MAELTENQIAYQQFLLTDFWRSTSSECIRLAGFRCSECGGLKFLQAHHIKYPWPWTETKQEHLKCLCDKCHRKAHGIPEPRVRKVVTKYRRRKQKKRRFKPIEARKKTYINVEGHRYVY